MKLLVKTFTPLFDIVKFTWTKRGPPPGKPMAARGQQAQSPGGKALQPKSNGP